MSVGLITRYRAEGARHAALAETFAVALVAGEIPGPEGVEYAREDLREHNRLKERYRQQADALESDPAAWVRRGPAWLD